MRDRTEPLPWWEDRYAEAAACARPAAKPIVIDLWAPWCHTCLSMQQTVLRDPTWASYAPKFVWVSLDTDRPENEQVVARYPPLAWPTFYVVEPVTGEILSRFVGGASLSQFKAFLDAGLGAARRSARDPEALVAKAHAEEARKQWGSASRFYDEALEASPPTWGRRPDILVSRLRAFVRAEAFQAGLDFARKEGLSTGDSASAADFAYYALRCAEAVKDADIAFLEPLAEHVHRAVADGGSMSVDDRSDALRILREMALFRDRPSEARTFAEAQRKLLDSARAGASAKEIMTSNWPAAEVYAFLGIPEALVPSLEANVKALPEEYDPPYRLAWLLLQGKQPERARAHALRALVLVYGPRKARVYDLLAQIEKARGDSEAEIQARQKTVEVLRGLPKGQANPKYLAEAEKRLASLQDE